MKRKLDALTLGLLWSTLLLPGVSTQENTVEDLVNPRSVSDVIDLREAKLAEPSLGAAFAARHPPTELTIDISRSRMETLAAYGPWLTATGISQNARQLVQQIEDSRVHGLNPEAYGLSYIHELLDQLSLSLFAPTPADEHPDRARLRAELDRALDQGFARLAQHLGEGVVDAGKVQTRLHRQQPRVNTRRLRERLVSGQFDTNQALMSVMPTSDDYRRLTATMRDLLTEKATGLAPTRITGKLPLGLGDRQHAVTQLKERLIETGDLGYFARLDWHFDAELEEALQRFQTRSGLEDTGILDDRTLAELNLPIEEEIERIALSLERWRWMPRKLGKRHIIVNIPNYKVEMYDGHQLILDMVAVVGAARYPTPNFSRDMSYIEFNPTWTVPSRIVNEELVPRERRRPGYLASRNFAFFRHTGKGLREVPASSVPRSAFRQTPFPYVLRQRSGAGNALGRMKFMMPNPHAIYLHDTQAKELFEHHDRAYSHGCIRLGDPEYFARLLMRLDGRSESEIEQALAERETHRVRLRSRIPTHLIYMTTWVDAYGAIQHRRDVYQHDANLVAALKRANTLLNVMNTLDVATVEIKDRNLNALLASR